MSRLSCVPAVLLLAATAAGAAPKYMAGVKGGVNVADLSGDATSGAESKSGFAGGAFFGADFNEHVGARIEGFYIMKGAKGSIVTPGDDHAHEATWTIDYLEFPLLVAGYLPLGNSMRVSGFAGPTFGFNLKSEIETTHAVEDLGSTTQTFEFGGAFGGGLEYRFPAFSLLADVRYSLGGTNVPEEIGDLEIDVKNRGLGLLFGVGIPIGGR
jgi:hypothetical protein